MMIDRETMSKAIQESERVVALLGHTPTVDLVNPSYATWNDEQEQPIKLERTVHKHRRGTIIDNYRLTQPGAVIEYTGPELTVTGFSMTDEVQPDFAGLNPTSDCGQVIFDILKSAPPAIIVRRPTLAELPAVQQLRHKILDPARKVKTDETMGPEYFDPSFVQLAAFCGKNVVATARFGPLPNDECEVHGVATADGLRRQGLASKVMIVGEKIARLQGASSFTLDSREDSIPFYESLGYELLTGECVTEEDDVPNFTMTKQVNNG